MMAQSHIFYSGTVQGVGFRYSVQRLAAPLKLTGWVRNLSDGRVEILIEGLQKDIETLIQQIDTRFDGYIKDKQISLNPARGEFKDFSIQ